MARKLSRQAMLTLLNSVGEGFSSTVPIIAEQAGIGENAVRKKAKKAIEQKALTLEATNIWRGWLHLNGPVAQTTPPADPQESLLAPEEALTLASLPPALPEAERMAMGDVPEQLVDTDEPPFMPLAVPKPKRRTRRRQTALWLRMMAMPIDSNYEDVLRAYTGNRTVNHPEWQLRRYVALKDNAKLPSHVRNLVLTHPTVSPYTGQPIQGQFVEKPAEPMPDTLPGEVRGLSGRMAAVEAVQKEVDALVGVMGREIDMIVEELGLAEQPSKPFFQNAILFLPRLTYTSVHRMLRASRAFVRVMMGRESGGTTTGEDRE